MARLSQRRDPAPSRWAYRWQRIWLTPLWRFGFRVALPLGVLACVIMAIWADPVRAGAIKAHFAQMQSALQNRQEFRLTTLSIEGASPELADAVRAKLNIRFPLSSFDLDLPALRRAAQDLPAVADAQIFIRSGGLVRMVITERVPAMVWRADNDLWLLDDTGHRVAMLYARQDRADLPLVSGQGADAAAAEALDILAAASPLGTRVQGLVRMGKRRWDLVLDYGQRLMLPAENPIAALDRALALDQAERLFDRDISAIDLRNGERPVLRLAPYAHTQRQIRLGLIQPVETLP
jgi:cell division protein FtsQ